MIVEEKVKFERKEGRCMCASLSVTVSVCAYIYSIMMKREKRECRGRDVAAGLRRVGLRRKVREN